jgi:hypothetical protein
MPLNRKLQRIILDLEDLIEEVRCSDDVKELEKAVEIMKDLHIYNN